MLIEQKQKILNLYYSGIPIEIIANETDLDIAEIKKIIDNEEEKKKKRKELSGNTSIADFYLDAIVNIDEIIKNAQSRIWKALQVNFEFDVSTDESKKFLERFIGTKINLVMIHVDLVGSTKLCMTLPVNRLADILRAYAQEMSNLIIAYGGYVLKYVGDAILGFFLVKSLDKHDLSFPCTNAVNCGISMIKVVKQGINPILSQYDYPEISVRIGIDVGENAIVQYGWENNTVEVDNKFVTIKRPITDILGYTISITAKMTSMAKPDQMVIGQFVYESLQEDQKIKFNELKIRSDVWNYISNSTGKIYKIYGSSTKNT